MHRSVHHGAILLVFGSLQFIVAMIVTQTGYGSSYSLTQNYISDLGATTCGTVSGLVGTSGGHYVCSPWHDVFNVSIIILGLLIILAVLLLRTAFPARRSRTIGLVLLALAGAGAIGVGLFPENVNIDAHVIASTIAFVGSAFALGVLGLAMFRDTRWDGFRAYTMLSGLVTLVALILFVAKTDGALGVGGMERLIVAPILLWAIVVGLHLERIPTFAPRTISKASTG